MEDLKKELQTLKKIKWVDKANEIATTYGNMGKPKFLQRADSINRYANLALNEALNAGYKKRDSLCLNTNSHNETLSDQSHPFLNFRADRKMVKVFLEDIFFIESLKDYIKVVTTNKLDTCYFDTHSSNHKPTRNKRCNSITSLLSCVDAINTRT